MEAEVKQRIVKLGLVDADKLTYLELLKAEKDRLGRQRFIEFTVDIYKRIFKKEYIAIKKENKKLSKTRADKFASLQGFNKSGYGKINEIRWALSLPKKVNNVLNYYVQDPPFLSTSKELRWFMKRFPEFHIPEKI